MNSTLPLKPLAQALASLAPCPTRFQPTSLACRSAATDGTSAASRGRSASPGLAPLFEAWPCCELTTCDSEAVVGVMPTENRRPLSFCVTSHVLGAGYDLLAVVALVNLPQLARFARSPRRLGRVSSAAVVSLLPSAYVATVDGISALEVFERNSLFPFLPESPSVFGRGMLRAPCALVASLWHGLRGRAVVAMSLSGRKTRWIFLMLVPMAWRLLLAALDFHRATAPFCPSGSALLDASFPSWTSRVRSPSRLRARQARL